MQISLETAIALAEEHYDLYLRALPLKSDLPPAILDLLQRYEESPSLTGRQAKWLEHEIAKVAQIEPLYGNFNAIQVMFQIAGEKLKRPKIRLVTSEGTFLQLTFIPDTKTIVLHRDGWQGHGRRRHIGWIQEDLIKPKYLDAISPDIFSIIHDFSLDPQAVAKACALKLGACGFCGSRLSDPESKRRGYGPVCAENFRLPWGDRTEESIKQAEAIAQADDLSSLFT